MDAILVVNAGSSSLKFQIKGADGGAAVGEGAAVADDETVLGGIEAEAIGGRVVQKGAILCGLRIVCGRDGASEA